MSRPGPQPRALGKRIDRRRSMIGEKLVHLLRVLPAILGQGREWRSHGPFRMIDSDSLLGGQRSPWYALIRADHRSRLRSKTRPFASTVRGQVSRDLLLIYEARWRKIQPG